MKLLIPIFKKLPIHSGGSLKNLKIARNLSQETDLLVRLWRKFEVLAEKRLPFHESFSQHFFLNELFSEQELEEAGLATVEFDISRLPSTEKFESIEVQFLLKSKLSTNRASVLFDLIPDKKPGHTYTPILHAGHSAWVDSNTDSYAVLLNFRPPHLKTEEKVQRMHIQAKAPTGEILSERKLDIPYNETVEISYREEFKNLGGFQPGCTLNFSGGSSQFAIFTAFTNQMTQAIGIEHSLPPYYYCSGVFEPKNRMKFYQRAFSDLRK